MFMASFPKPFALVKHCYKNHKLKTPRVNQPN